MVTEYTGDSWANVYLPLTASVSGDMKSSPEDLVGLTYLISAPVINPMSWLAMRHRFQRNVSLLFSVLKTSQTHITPALAQLQPRMDYNQFFECT